MSLSQTKADSLFILSEKVVVNVQITQIKLN